MVLNPIMALQARHSKSWDVTKKFVNSSKKMVQSAVAQRNVIATPNTDIVLFEEGAFGRGIAPHFTRTLVRDFLEWLAWFHVVLERYLILPRNICLRALRYIDLATSL